MKAFLALCLLALATAEPESKPWGTYLQPSYYSNWAVRPSYYSGLNYVNRPAATWGYSSGVYGNGYVNGIWKRSADSESESSADSKADPWLTYAANPVYASGWGGYALPTSYASSYAYSRPALYSNNLWNNGLYSSVYGANRLWKREAESEPTAESSAEPDPALLYNAWPATTYAASGVYGPAVYNNNWGINSYALNNWGVNSYALNNWAWPAATTTYANRLWKRDAESKPYTISQAMGLGFIPSAPRIIHAPSASVYGSTWNGWANPAVYNAGWRSSYYGW